MLNILINKSKKALLISLSVTLLLCIGFVAIIVSNFGTSFSTEELKAVNSAFNLFKKLSVVTFAATFVSYLFMISPVLFFFKLMDVSINTFKITLKKTRDPNRAAFEAGQAVRKIFAEIRGFKHKENQYHTEYNNLNSIECKKTRGSKFEELVKKLYTAGDLVAYTAAELKAYGKISSSGVDQGADVFVFNKKNQLVKIIQTKHYSGKVDNKAVQEIIAAKAYYRSQFDLGGDHWQNVGIEVVTNSVLSGPALDLAKRSGVFVVNGNDISKHLNDISFAKSEEKGTVKEINAGGMKKLNF
jgi:HJR/Mrr/RecB family endonuclease